MKVVSSRWLIFEHIDHGSYDAYVLYPGCVLVAALNGELSLVGRAYLA